MFMIVKVLDEKFIRKEREIFQLQMKISEGNMNVDKEIRDKFMENKENADALLGNNEEEEKQIREKNKREKSVIKFL